MDAKQGHAIEDGTGRQICYPDNPMPPGASGRWAHTNVEDDGECSDGCCDYFRCKDCGLRWREEVAQ